MKRDERKIALHCAVYTRVSTDSGLEQDFNSLDNQREASEAYVKRARAGLSRGGHLLDRRTARLSACSPVVCHGGIAGHKTRFLLT